MKKAIHLILGLLAINGSIAQNRFSHFYSSPLLFNPANTGRFNKSYRVGSTFRSEKNIQGQVYTQKTFFFDSKLFNSVLPENDCFGVGVLGLAEQSISEGIKNSYLALSIAYQKGFDNEGRQQLSVGFQTTLANKQLKPPSLIFEDQINSWIMAGYTDIDIFRITAVNLSYVDLSAGLIYQGVIDKNTLFSVGASVYHANRPNKVFQGGELNLSYQQWYHAALEKKISDKGKIYTSILLSCYKKIIDDLLFGSYYQMDITKGTQLNIGGYFRKSSSRGVTFIPIAGLGYNGFSLNLSYDISLLKKNNMLRGASEISLTYNHALSREKFMENRFIKF